MWVNGRRIAAIILGPSPLILYVLSYRLPGQRVGGALVLLAAVAMQLFFWPPTLATQLLGRHPGLRSTVRLLVPMALLSWLWAFVWELLIVRSLHAHYEWYRAAHDSLDPAVLSAFCFILFRFLWNPESRLNWYGRDSATRAKAG